MFGHHVGKLFSPWFAKRSERHHADRLKSDAAAPLTLHFPEHCPASIGKPFMRIEVRAYRRHAMDVCAAHAKVHPQPNVLGAPMFSILPPSTVIRPRECRRGARVEWPGLYQGVRAYR